MKYSSGRDQKVVAVCVARFMGNDQTEYIRAFYDVFSKNKIKMFIFSSVIDFIHDYGTICEEQIYELMEPEKFDAVIVLSDTFKKQDIPKEIAKRCQKSGTPCISVLATIDGCVNVHFDFAESFETVARHVIEHHKVRHVNFIAGSENNPYSEERLAVYKKVMTENGLPIEDDRIGYGDFWETPTAKVMDDFFRTGKPIDAIICANDYMAFEACKQLKARGIRVPEDVIVSGFDGVKLEEFHYPRLATVRHDVDEIATSLLDIIENACASLPVERDYYVGCKFRIGQSCGCVPMDEPFSDVTNTRIMLYSSNRRVRDLSTHMEEMYEKVPALGDEESLSNVWGTLFYFANRFIKSDVAFLANSDYLDEDMELWPTLAPASYNEVHNYYTDELRVALNHVNGVLDNGYTISRTNLVVDIDKIFENDGCVMFLPVHIQGSTVGYMYTFFVPGTVDLYMLYSYVMNLRNIIFAHKVKLDQQNLYSTDQLTRLLNRTGFIRHMEGRLKTAIREKIPLGVISLDMNGLKQVNDIYGHKEGDFVLSKIGFILEKANAGFGVCTRFGGDEFAIALTGFDAKEQCERIIAEIGRLLERFNESIKKPYSVSISAGYVCKVPTGMSSLDECISEADKLMYEYKNEHR